MSVVPQVAARTQHSETIKVENWAPVSQRFRVIPALDSAPPATAFTGPETIAVPAHGSASWTYKFSARAEGTATGRVTFKNEATGEYRFWNVHFKVRLILTLKIGVPLQGICKSGCVTMTCMKMMQMRPGCTSIALGTTRASHGRRFPCMQTATVSCRGKSVSAGHGI